jgi:ribosomal protein S27AE
MCNCRHGKLDLEKLECNNCSFIYYQVDEEGKEENLLCPKCREGFGIVIEENE